MGVPIGAGLRFLQDAHQRFTRSGTPVHLRVKNFTEEKADGSPEEYIEVGVEFAPSGTHETGVTDILIDPPPAVQDVSPRNVGKEMYSRLNFGSHIFHISHTWVQQQMDELRIKEPTDVFGIRDGKRAVGLVFLGQLFEVEKVTHDIAGGEFIGWKVIGNALEVKR